MIIYYASQFHIHLSYSAVSAKSFDFRSRSLNVWDWLVAHSVGEEVGGHSALVSHEHLQFNDLLVNALDKLQDEVDELLLLELKQVLVPDQE